MQPDLCKIITCVGLLVAVALAVVILNRVDKNCCGSKQGFSMHKGNTGSNRQGFNPRGNNLKWAPPNPSGSASWSGGAAQVADCQSAFANNPSEQGDPMYYCDNGSGQGYMMETNDLDSNCPSGTPVAYTAADCSSPSVAGQGYLCGGPNFSSCQQQSSMKGRNCITQGNLPLGATGYCL